MCCLFYQAWHRVLSNYEITLVSWLVAAEADELEKSVLTGVSV